MRKYHRYNKQEISLYIEKWQESKMSPNQYCHQENLAESTFRYWLKKYKMEKVLPETSKKCKDKSFIPVRVNPSINTLDNIEGPIEIYYPNGVRLRCSFGIDMSQLKNLISI